MCTQLPSLQERDRLSGRFGVDFQLVGWAHGVFCSCCWNGWKPFSLWELLAAAMAMSAKSSET